MTNTASPTPEEIRALVERIVDGLVAGAAEEVAVTGRDAADTGRGHELEAADVDEASAATGVIALGADHGGYPLKEKLAFRLKEAGWTVIDCGTHSHDSVDYPDFAHEVAATVAKGTAQWGIVVDGAGIGSAMVANKVPGIRAALCYDLSTARNSREHNHANVLTLGAGLTGDGLAWQIVQEWLAVDHGGGRHARRVAKIADIEQQYSSRR